jgi:uncharacterized membrane protein YhiD involved in acid resistance
MDEHFIHITLRLLASLAIGTAIGLQRELTHKPAGLRTHMLVGLGTCSLLVGATEASMDQAAISRIIQGLVTGIGQMGIALLATLFALLILIVFRKFEKELGHHVRRDAEGHPHFDPKEDDS